MSPHYDQGKYYPINPQKYIGHKQAFYRSGMEKKLFLKLDQNPKVIRWATELFSIKYIFDMDQRQHSYWLDLYYESVNKNNQIEKYIVEIKPYSQLSVPKQPKNKTMKAIKNFNYKMVQYRKNMSKWKFAAAFGRANNMQFLIITDGGVFIYENGLKQLTDKSFF